MHTIHSEIQVSRRKRLIVIFDETGTVSWTGSKFDAALEHLWDKGEQTVRLEGEDHVFDLSLVKVVE